jgi:hypothetical protein
MHKYTLSQSQAESIIVKHVQAFICPYEVASSEEVTFFFSLVPYLMENPDADLDELCVIALECEIPKFH